MAISLSGIGSGLDIRGLVSQLVQAEGEAKNNALNRRESGYKTELSALGTLKSSLSAFKDAAAKLADADDILAVNTTSADEDAFSASANSSAGAGEYSIEVLNLAKAQKLSTAGFASGNDTLGSGSLEISSGDNTFTVDIAAGQDSLFEIRDAINAAADNDSVSASIINVDDGAGGTEARLVLTANSSGTANAISVAVTDDDGNSNDNLGLSRLAYDAGSGTGNLQQIVAAEDASLKVDGLAVTRSSNSIDDIISGITLELKAESTGPKSLSVAVDTSATKEKVQAFVDAYNKLADTYKQLSGYNAETERAGALQGDFTARQILNEVRSTLRSSTGNGGEFDSLFSLGMEIDQHGKMSIDSDKLDNVLNTKPKALTSLLSGEEGVAGRLEAQLKEALDLGGILDSRTKSLDQSIDKVGDERLDLEDRLQTLEKRMLNQFIAMDSLVAQYNNTGSYLAGQLASLPGFTTPKS